MILCCFILQSKTKTKRKKSLDYSYVYRTIKYAQLFIKGKGLISSDIKWTSKREEGLFYSPSQLVRDVKLTFLLQASTPGSSFTFTALSVLLFLFVLGAEGGGSINEMGKEMSTGP